MRIIDKNKDFYDYLSGIYRDDTFTFDRSNSFVLKKDHIILSASAHPTYHMRTSKYDKSDKTRTFLLLQVCNSFWLFVVDLETEGAFGKIKKNDIRLLKFWKNFNKERVLIKFGSVNLGWKHTHCIENLTQKDIDAISAAIDTGDYKVKTNLCECSVYDNGKWIQKSIPLFKESGLVSMIDPLDIYLSFEEYFSLEKMASERCESKDITDKEKIENHGFDYRISFRGNNK